MVHRQADSRLLTNLIQQEKDYSKQVNQLLDSSCAALAALAAYAASSPPPVSHVIMELTGTLGAADAALKRYALGVDEWRETMRTLKDAEEEVGNIMRDREILVTRLIKASKSQKSGVRESLLLGPQRFPSSSSLSLSTSAHNDSPSPPPSRPLSSSFSTSNKLAAAQTELQACEAHLASKERELEQKRSAAIRDGLGIRMKAMMDCGWVWNELGKEGLRTLDQLRVKPPDTVPQDDERFAKRTGEGGARPYEDFSSIGPSQSVSQVNSMHNAPPPVSMAAVLNTGAFGEALHADADDDHDDDDNDHEHDHHEHEQQHNHRDLAEQAKTHPPPPPAAVTDQQIVISDSSNGSSSLSKLAMPTTYKIETVTYAPAVPLFIAGKDASAAAAAVPPAAASAGQRKAESVKSDYSSIQVPPPHAIEGYMYGFPTAAPSASASASNLNVNANGNGNVNGREDATVVSPRSTPTTSPAPTPQRRSSFTTPPIISAFHTHKLERRITEEDVRRRSVGGTEEKSEDEGSEQEEKEKEKLVREGKLEVVENPRFMSEARRREVEAEKEREKEKEGATAADAARPVTVSGTAADDDEVMRTPGKERKRFGLFHSGKDTAHSTPTKGSGSLSRPPMHRAHESDAQLSVVLSDTGKASASANANASPSKGGFFGGIKSLFAPRQVSHSQSHSQSQAQPTSPTKLKLLQDSPVLVDRGDVDTMPSDSDEEDAPGAKRRLSKRRGLFSSRAPAEGDRRQKDKEKEKGWETRTDRNLRAIQRAGSFDAGLEHRVYAPSTSAKVKARGVGAGAVASVGLGTPAAAAVSHPQTGAGVVQRNRAASDGGVGTAAPALMGTQMQGRKLKKRGPGAAPGSPGAVVSDAENYFETQARPAPHAAPAAAAAMPLSVPRAPQPAAANLLATSGSAPITTTTTTTTTASKTTATPAQGWWANDRRRSSSAVDVTLGAASRKSWMETEDADGNGAMIVDLGRRRVASEVGAPGVAAQAAAQAAVGGVEGRPLKSAIRMQPSVQPQQPQQQQQPQRRAPPAASKPAHAADTTREYASDTGAAPSSSAQAARKKSLTKKKPQAPESTVSMGAVPPPPPPVPASPLLSSLGPAVASPAVRRASVKAPVISAAPLTAPAPAATTATTAASARKGRSATAGGTTATVMPAEGRHPSGTLVSEPGWATQSHTQGGALSRNTSSASAGSAAARRKQTVLGQGMGTSGEHRRAASLGPAAGAPVAAAAAAPSTTTQQQQQQHVRAASGGTLIQPLGPAASLMSIVEDVARVNREGWGRDAKVQKSVGGSQVPTGMMDVVKAPPPMGRKFYEAMGDAQKAAPSATQSGPPQALAPVAPTQTAFSRTGMFEVTAPRSVLEQRENVGQASAAPPVQARQPQPQLQPQLHAAPVGPGKVPLRSALRTSRSPSPVITASRAQTSPATKPLPPPVDGRLPWDGEDASSAPRFTAAQKGKAPVRGPPPPPDEESGDESNYETGDEMLDAQEGVGPDGKPRFVRRSSSGRRVQAAAPLPAVNGHAVGYEQRDKPREPPVSHSAASTVVGQPQSAAPPAAFSDQEPRRRKSVRVSLQPTFSPSPPAIEYDDEEEQRLHAPWAFSAERPIERERQPLVLQAPAPVYPQPTQTVVSSQVDMWADSDEEDEEYLKAKRLLSRAAKKEKDVSRMVANRAKS